MLADVCDHLGRDVLLIVAVEFVKAKLFARAWVTAYRKSEYE